MWETSKVEKAITSAELQFVDVEGLNLFGTPKPVDKLTASSNTMGTQAVVKLISLQLYVPQPC